MSRSTPTCQAPGCNEPVGYSSKTGKPNKYGKRCGHAAASRAAFKNMIAAQKEEREQRDELFRAVAQLAMEEGVKAAESANALSVPVSRTLVFQPNRKFSNFLVRDGLGTETPEGVVVHFPPVRGSKEQAQAVFETLKPLTATGEVLEGQRIILR